MALRIGTSGFLYEDWRAILYPRGLPKNRFLERYAEEFDSVELNFTYYAMPTAKTLGRLVRRTPDGFGFSTKLHRSMTHERDAEEAAYRAFLEALRPMVDGGRLLAVLGQFPQSLHPDRAAREHLERLRERFRELPLVYEFRNRAWIRDEVRRWLRRLGVGYCCVDQPALPNLVPAVLWATAPTAYVRLHGRNATQWYDGDAATRYDYRYAPHELGEWKERLVRLAPKAETTLVYFNNHFRGNAVHNARELKGLLGAD
jgi:uncharacterized protein YecE (DUF72 family)